MPKATNSTDLSHWYLFFIFPVLAGFNALKYFRAPWAKNIIWAFVVFYGFTIGISNEKSSEDGGTADIFRYAEKISDFNKLELSISKIQTLYIENDDVDILNLTLAIGISRFTDSMQVMAAIYGFIFGFFFTRNMWYVLERISGKIQPALLILIAAFFLVNPIWNLGGFRFWTAAHIFIYGILPFLFEGKKGGLLVSVLSILVHFSFMLPVAVLLLYLILGNRTVIFFAFFLASIFVSEIKITAFNTFIEENTSEKFAKRTSGYRSEEAVEQFRQAGEEDEAEGPQISWHARYYVKALTWSLMAFLFFLFFKRKVLQQLHPAFLNSLSFTLLFWGFANIMSSIPSGGRFLTVAALSAFPLIIFYLQSQPKETGITNLLRITMPALLLYIIVAARIGFYSFSLNTILGNPLIELFMDTQISLNDIIK